MYIRQIVIVISIGIRNIFNCDILKFLCFVNFQIYQIKSYITNWLSLSHRYSGLRERN